MKNYLLAITCLIAMCTLSCSKNNKEDAPDQAAIIGKWQAVHSMQDEYIDGKFDHTEENDYPQTEENRMIFEFKNNGVLIVSGSDDDDEFYTESIPYEASSDVIVFTSDNDDWDGNFKYKVSGNELVITNDVTYHEDKDFRYKIEIHFKRIN